LTIDRIPTISTQLKILATVKATMFGANGNYNYIDYNNVGNRSTDILRG